MGEGFVNNRLSYVRHGAETFTWRNQPIEGPGVGPVVEHTVGTPVVSIRFLDEETRIPLLQARWLAEALLGVTDHYRELFDIPVGEDDSDAGAEPAPEEDAES